MIKDIKMRFENRLWDSESWKEFYDNHEPDIAYLIGEVERLQKVERDYKALTDIMDRARKLAYQASEVEEKPIFEMVDGCLTRIDYTKEGDTK